MEVLSLVSPLELGAFLFQSILVSLMFWSYLVIYNKNRRLFLRAFFECLFLGSAIYLLSVVAFYFELFLLFKVGVVFMLLVVLLAIFGFVFEIKALNNLPLFAIKIGFYSIIVGFSSVHFLEKI